jgi:hypothetical protein
MTAPGQPAPGGVGRAAGGTGPGHVTLDWEPVPDGPRACY